MRSAGLRRAERLYLVLMMFAFSWVVIGDLVQFHLDLILGKGMHVWHQPFTKAEKGSTKTLKVQEKVKEGGGHHGGLVFVIPGRSMFGYEERDDLQGGVQELPVYHFFLPVFASRAPPAA